MEASNDTMEAVAVHQIELGHNFFGDVILTVRYGVAVVAILLNAAIIIAFLMQKLRRPTAVHVSAKSLLVLNLLVADTLVGVVIFLNISTSFSIMNASTWCEARSGITYMVTISSHIALLNVVFDRFIAITYPLKYCDWMTFSRSVFIVCTSWMIPLAGAIAVVKVAPDDWYSGVARCSEIYASKAFLKYVWIPMHFTANISVIIIQIRVYLSLRRHDAHRATSNQVKNCSDKSAWILLRITTPTYLSMLFLDVMRIVLMSRINQLILNTYQVTLLFVQVSFLMNPLMFSYATASIRKPVSDLCDDMKKLLRSTTDGEKEESSSTPASLKAVCVIESSST